MSAGVEIALAIAMFACVQGQNAAEHRQAHGAAVLFSCAFWLFAALLTYQAFKLVWAGWPGY
jgi:hypothetical protein